MDQSELNEQEQRLLSCHLPSLYIAEQYTAETVFSADESVYESINQTQYGSFS